jgi:hypothetical protein
MSRQLCETLFAAQDPLSKGQTIAAQELLFLESGEAYARVDAYAANSLQSRVGPRAFEFNSAKAQTSHFGAHEGFQDDFRITEMVSLRTPEQLLEYQKDAKGFRAFFIRQRISYSPLLITADLLDQLLVTENISPQLKDYLIFYGKRVREVEIVPPVLKFRPLVWSRIDGHNLDHECMYGLRFFEPNGRGSMQEPTTQWSLRQSTIYSRSCSSTEETIWLFITISPIVQRRLDAYITGNQRADLANNFEIHLIILQTVISNWRFFLIALSAEIDEEAAQIAGTSFNNAGPVNLFDSNRRQHLVYLGEMVSTAVLVAKATSHTVETLSHHHHHHHHQITQVDGMDSVGPNIIAAGLLEQIRILSSIIPRLDTMRAKIQASSVLLSSLLDQSSGHALETLAQESRNENMEMRALSERMHKLTEKATQDAAAVKVLTIMTLIYLPATVISNFFSTSFVVTESSPSHGAGHISVLADWWIFIVVTLPLTAITLYIWWIWTRIKTHGEYPWWLRALRALPRDHQSPNHHDLENGFEKPPGTSSPPLQATPLGSERGQKLPRRHPGAFAGGGVNASMP